MSVALKELKEAAKRKKKSRKGKKGKDGKKKKKKSKKSKGQDEEEEEMIDVVDPWKGLPSAWGGRASPAEEYEHLLKLQGVWLDLSYYLKHGGGSSLFLPEGVRTSEKVESPKATMEATAEEDEKKETKREFDGVQYTVVPMVAGVPTLIKGDLDRLVAAATAPEGEATEQNEGIQKEELPGGLAVETEKIYDSEGGAHVTTRVVASNHGVEWEGGPWTPRSGKANSAVGSPDEASPLQQVAAQEKAAAATAASKTELSPIEDNNNVGLHGDAVDVRQSKAIQETPKWMPHADMNACERISLCGLGLYHLGLSPQLRCSLIALNLDNNCMTDEALKAMMSVEMPLVRNKDLTSSYIPLFLRELRLCDNSLTIVPDVGETAGTLLILDLSNNPNLSVADPVSEQRLAAMVRLRRLELKQCRIELLCRHEPPPTSDAGQHQLNDNSKQNNHSQVPPVCSLGSNNATLEYLDISGNSVKDFAQLRSLTILKRLKFLAIRGNPVSLEVPREEYCELVRKMCLKLSALKQFNGEKYTHGMQASSFADMQAGKDVNSGVSAGGGDDSASCSCLEGNPCVSAYSCKNWAKRYEVAKANGWKGF